VGGDICFCVKNPILVFHAFNSFCPKVQNAKGESNLKISPSNLYILSMNPIVKYWKVLKNAHREDKLKKCIFGFAISLEMKT